MFDRFISCQAAVSGRPATRHPSSTLPLNLPFVRLAQRYPTFIGPLVKLNHFYRLNHTRKKHAFPWPPPALRTPACSRLLLALLLPLPPRYPGEALAKNMVFCLGFLLKTMKFRQVSHFIPTCSKVGPLGTGEEYEGMEASYLSHTRLPLAFLPAMPLLLSDHASPTLLSAGLMPFGTNSVGFESGRGRVGGQES